jgi:hypothetical protein
MKFTDYFQSVFVINLDRRTDRWAECVEEFLAAKIPLSMVTRWSAWEKGQTPQSSGSHSHRDVIRHIAQNKIPRALILEDDFAAITTKVLIDAGHKRGLPVMDTHCSVLDGNGSFAQRFEAMIPFLQEYDFLYIGGAYASPPIYRENKHVIRCDKMKCCSSYVVTSEAASKWTAMMDRKTNYDIHFNCGAADDIIAGFSDVLHYSCLQPRLLYQRSSRSDLTGNVENYLDSMTNPDHEAMV